MTAPRLALLLAPFLLAACSSAAPATPDPAHADVIFQGSATDAALTAMLAAAPVDDPTHAAYFDNPKDLAEIPGTPIITFTWHDGQEAPAGTPARSGEAYLLAFSALDTGDPLFRVFTSETSYTPDATAWAKLATGTWTVLDMESATFSGTALAAGSAPVRGQEIKFCIGMWQ